VTLFWVVAAWVGIPALVVLAVLIVVLWGLIGSILESLP